MQSLCCLKPELLYCVCCYGSDEVLLADPVRYELETATTSSFPAFPSVSYMLNLKYEYANGNFFQQLRVYPRHVNNAVNVIFTAWAYKAGNNSV